MIKDLGACSAGNILEWLDFGLFIYLAPLLGQHFFASHGQNVTLEVLAVFAIGFICRPLGSILFGFLGDRYGRVFSLRLSILSITLTMVFIGCLPSYHSIGPLATILFIGLRLCQGLSVGGEYSAAMIYLTESAPPLHRGFVTSFAAVGANIGFLLASVLAWLLQCDFASDAIKSFAWRLPFLIAGALGLLIFYFRLRLLETPTYQRLALQNAFVAWPLWAALQKAPRRLLQIFGLSCMGAVLYYVFFGYMPTYLHNNYGVPLSRALSLQVIFLIIMLILVPCAGWLGDRFGRRRMLRLTALGIIVAAWPCFYGLQNLSWLALLSVFSVATVLSSLEQGNTLTTVVENCPAAVRVSGVAFAYNSGMALFGGTAPWLVAHFSYINTYAPAYYLMAAALISGTVLLTIPERSHRDLDIDESS